MCLHLFPSFSIALMRSIPLPLSISLLQSSGGRQPILCCSCDGLRSVFNTISFGLLHLRCLLLLEGFELALEGRSSLLCISFGLLGLLKLLLGLGQLLGLLACGFLLGLGSLELLLGSGKLRG